MTNKITRKEVAKQFSIAIQLLLEWIDQRGNSREKINNNDIEEYLHEPRLLTATEVARILKISKSSAYQLIQQNKIPSVRINRNVRVKQEDLEDFVVQNRV